MARHPVDAEEFYRMTGDWPSGDDLHRCNCLLAGAPGHLGCGVCKHSQPVFRCPECFEEAALRRVEKEKSP